MGLLQLLQAAESEVANRTALHRWRMAVSGIIDRGDAGLARTLFVSQDGNDATAVPGSLVLKYRTVAAALAAAAATPALDQVIYLSGGHHIEKPIDFTMPADMNIVVAGIAHAPNFFSPSGDQIGSVLESVNPAGPTLIVRMTTGSFTLSSMSIDNPAWSQWESAQPYIVGDTVQNGGSFYVAIANNVGSAPPSAPWLLQPAPVAPAGSCLQIIGSNAPNAFVSVNSSCGNGGAVPDIVVSGTGAVLFVESESSAGIQFRETNFVVSIGSVIAGIDAANTTNSPSVFLGLTTFVPNGISIVGNFDIDFDSSCEVFKDIVIDQTAGGTILGDQASFSFRGDAEGAGNNLSIVVGQQQTYPAWDPVTVYPPNSDVQYDGQHFNAPGGSAADKPPLINPGIWQSRGPAAPVDLSGAIVQTNVAISHPAGPPNPIVIAHDTDFRGSMTIGNDVMLDTRKSFLPQDAVIATGTATWDRDSASFSQAAVPGPGPSTIVFAGGGATVASPVVPFPSYVGAQYDVLYNAQNGAAAASISGRTPTQFDTQIGAIVPIDFTYQVVRRP